MPKRLLRSEGQKMSEPSILPISYFSGPGSVHPQQHLRRPVLSAARHRTAAGRPTMRHPPTSRRHHIPRTGCFSSCPLFEPSAEPTLRTIAKKIYFDEFEKMTNTLTDLLYPIVIEKTLQNKLFDFQDLYDKHKSCSGNCSGGCGGCH